jgi:hypothetical protein
LQLRTIPRNLTPHAACERSRRCLARLRYAQTTFASDRGGTDSELKTPHQSARPRWRGSSRNRSRDLLSSECDSGGCLFYLNDQEYASTVLVCISLDGKNASLSWAIEATYTRKHSLSTSCGFVRHKPPCACRARTWHVEFACNVQVVRKPNAHPPRLPRLVRRARRRPASAQGALPLHVGYVRSLARAPASRRFRDVVQDQ